MGCNNNPTYEMKELLENSTPGTRASIELYFNTHDEGTSPILQGQELVLNSISTQLMR